MIRILLLALAIAVSACATDPQSGERKVDQQLCAQRVADAEIGRAGCTFIDDQDARKKCELSYDVTIAAAKLGCSFADDVDGSETPAPQ